MEEFSILGFVAFFGALTAEMDHANHTALERAAVIVETEAKSVIGTYRYGWPSLGPDAVAKHGDTPLLDTGKLRDSIHHSSNDEHAIVGSDLEVAVYQELGTRSIPPRSFLMEAAVHKTDAVLNAIGRVVTSHLTGETLLIP
jgi:phage gpG-like protein